MKKASLTVLISLSVLAGAAYAQTEGGVTMSTDPAKAADVEQRAQALEQQQSTMPMNEATPMKKPYHKKKMMKKHMTKKAASAAEATPASGASQ